MPEDTHPNKQANTKKDAKAQREERHGDEEEGERKDARKGQSQNQARKVCKCIHAPAGMPACVLLHEHKHGDADQDLSILTISSNLVSSFENNPPWSTRTFLLMVCARGSHWKASVMLIIISLSEKTHHKTAKIPGVQKTKKYSLVNSGLILDSLSLLFNRNYHGSDA